MEERWISGPWRPDDDRPARLPRVEDLPASADGYDRASVEEAFDAFYRHAAQLDATLRLLESVEAFHRQAAELRADIRALRAASWLPAPVPRAWTESYVAAYSGRRAAPVLPEAAARVAVEAAFIVLVAVGALLADLAVALVVLVVLAAFLLVGLFEVVASTVTPSLRRRTAPAEAPVEPAPSEPVVAPVEQTMFEVPLREEPAEAQALAGEPDGAAGVADAAEAVPERGSEGAEVEPPGRAPGRLRWWRRRRPAVSDEAAEPLPKHVRVLPADPAAEAVETPAGDNHSGEADAGPPVVEAQAEHDATPAEPDATPQLALAAAAPDIANADPLASEPEPVEPPHEDDAEPAMEEPAVEPQAAFAVHDEPEDAQAHGARPHDEDEDTGERPAPIAERVEEPDEAGGEPAPEERPEPAVASADPWEQGPELPVEAEPAPEPLDRLDAAERGRWRLWRRRSRSEEETAEAEAERESADLPGHVRVVEIEPAVPPEDVAAAWEREPADDELAVADERHARHEASAARRAALRRGRR